jgi:hypothetical protein
MRRTIWVLWEALAAQLYRLRVDNAHVNMGQVSRPFQWRLTNTTQDEFISVAGVLRVPTAELLEVTGEQRCKLFYMSLGELPSDVVFLEEPNLTLAEFRWAPKILTHPSPTTMSTNSEIPNCRCTE